MSVVDVSASKRYSSLLVAGDICFDGLAQQEALANAGAGFWGGLQEAVGPNASAVVANLECPITAGGVPKPFKWANLRACPTLAPALQGLDLAILGNNHISDFGLEGVEDTLSALQRYGVASAGYGGNIREAFTPAIVALSGGTVAVVSLCCPTTNGENLATPASPGVAALGLGVLRRAIASAREQADSVLVYLHWGTDSHYPVPDQIRLARAAVDWGAGVVVGCHAHVIQGFECYKGRWIFYGLGNLLFGSVATQSTTPDGTTIPGTWHPSEANRQSLMVTLNLDGSGNHEALNLAGLHYVECGEDCVPRAITERHLTFDIGKVNRDIESYADRNAALLSSRDALKFQSEFMSGIPVYRYTSAPIGPPRPTVLSRGLRRFGRLANGWGRSLVNGRMPH